MVIKSEEGNSEQHTLLLEQFSKSPHAQSGTFMPVCDSYANITQDGRLEVHKGTFFYMMDLFKYTFETLCIRCFGGCFVLKKPQI